ncbi:ANTAR domain-containing protein [Streptomyces sp. NPDC088794]|uniref:ANTAR domain-containing protein n=1 Tax=Streptomyces sp. NPDC088794 TaxID=3365902 RepID=UPI0037F5B431
MTRDGMAEALRSLRAGSGADPARTTARALGVTGVVISVFPLPPATPNGGRAPEPLWWYPESSLRFEELQFTLGEGPGPDADRAGLAVLEPDLDRVRPDRWPTLLPAARQLGVDGVCCFPLGLGAVRLGMFTLLWDGRSSLDDGQLADANTLAAALTAALLDGRRPADRRDGNGDEGLPWPADGLHRAVVHQATGMISVQLDIPLAEALVRLRAFAYGSERLVGDVAEDVVARRLRFDDDGSGTYAPVAGEG